MIRSGMPTLLTPFWRFISCISRRIDQSISKGITGIANNPLGNIINATHVDNSYKWAGGGFISSTSDLVKFGQAHLQPGFLSEETLTELTTSQTLSAGESTDYGVGWSIDGDYLGHGGGSIGGITSFLMYPEDNLVLVMLSNSSVTNYGNVDHRIVGLFVKAKKAAQD